MKKCQHCNADLADGALFCGACGKSITEAPAPAQKSVATTEQKDLHEQVLQTWGEMKGFLSKKFDEKSALDQEKLDKFQTRLDALEAKSQRPAASPAVLDGLLLGSERKAFDKWMRFGVNVLTPEDQKSLVTLEQKALTSLNDPSTGYLVPAEQMPGIIKGITQFSPMRDYARVRTTSNRSVQVMKRTGQFAATWVGETETRTETEGLSYGQEEIFTKEMAALVDISQIDLEDNAFNLENELEMEFAEQFGVAEGAAFVLGSGPKQPEGILTNSSVAYTAGGDASKITADGMISLYYDVKDAYAKNATWFLRRSTMKAIRLLKIEDDQYLWQPGLQAGDPATILGRPYVETPDMPAIAADAYPVLFGDLRRAYYIVDRVAIQIVRDALTQATKGMIRFIARKRVGGMVVLPEAIRKLKIASA